MGILTNLFNRFRQSNSLNSPKSNLNPSPQANQIVNQPPVNQPPAIQALTNQSIDPSLRLAQLEAEANQIPVLEAKLLPKPKHNWKGKLIWTAILIGIPVTVLYVVNLPYPAIRRSVAKNLPVLLLPSQISTENNLKRSIELIEQAKQLIERPTSAADIELGLLKLKEGKESLNAIPLMSVDQWSEYTYGFYSWQYSWSRFQQIRGQVGELEAKAFQEKNAQTLLVDADLEVIKAKTQYQQAVTPTDKRGAIALWQSAIDKLNLIPSVTLAGKNAQQKLDGYQREFKELVGLAAGNERVISSITSAQQFARKAAQAGQNPPHTAERWLEIEKLWQLAIDDLSQISSQDAEAYIEARRLLAEYTANRSEIRIRRQAEEKSVIALDSAQKRIERLLVTTPSEIAAIDRNPIISQIQGVVNDLDRVQSGTTSYLKAQELKLFANNKLQQLQTMPK
jgi:hypothetical protein